MALPKRMKRQPREWNGFPLDARGRFNGKPMKYWNTKAKELVIQELIHGSMVDTRSIIGKKASDRLLELAKAEDPILFQKILDERDRCQRNITRTLAHILK